MAHLFEPLTLRGVTLPNRIGVSPMCQYSAFDGLANHWHMVHLGSRAVGGAGLVIVEATAVEARGRITPGDLGLWRDEQVEPLAEITQFIREQGSVPGIQLAHAGRKASTAAPWQGGHPLPESEGGWRVVAPSPVRFNDGYQIPHALTLEEIDGIRAAFMAAASRALAAGFDFLEIHAAHGYLLHSFHSPISNQRSDQYGGEFDNRIRLTLEIARDIRAVWPDDKPLAARLSCTDWLENGWTLEESIELARRLKSEGVDLIDCSSGGIAPNIKIPVGAGYQVPLSERIRREAGIATAAVGMISEPMQADEIIRNRRGDVVLLARELLRDPYWPRHAAEVLRQTNLDAIPPQYWRAHGR
jgi:2,4-dienoyl-CoA reductase-like NADH-dependent reductase (Old Yellow Enzyme family)